ncbi:hypothetical protein BC941DRAFT_413550 [Chlamydoabsidia padenii]|nr:hypothetical protein BC941DRAFT_413550 [Chlamydoabsidia padenii]
MDTVLAWDENKVNKWLASLGYSSFETQFKEQGITGDVLVNLDHDTLKDLTVHSVGQRMDILKHIYHLKLAQRIPINEWDYIPPSAVYENEYFGTSNISDYRKIEAAFQERDIHLKKLTDDLLRISGDMNRMRDDMMQLWKHAKDKKPLPPFDNDKSPSALKSSSGLNNSLKPLHMLTPPTTSHASDYFYGTYHDNNKRQGGSEATVHMDDNKMVPNVTINDGGAIKVYGEKISNNNKVELEASKNVRLLLDDPCSKVIISALKKYNVMDDWRQYALWIQYGTHDNTQERLLGYDEKPLRISQKLKEAKLNPTYVLKHVKDNKPFIPDIQKQPEINNNTNNGNNSPHNNNYNNHRLVQKPSYDSNINASNSSTYNQWKHSNEKSDQHPKTAITSGRVGYEMIAPVMSSSVSSPTPSSFPQRSNHTTAKSNDDDNTKNSVKEKDDYSSNTTSALNQKPPDQYLSDLGLESGVASAIYSIMMEQQQDSKPM